MSGDYILYIMFFPWLNECMCCCVFRVCVSESSCGSARVCHILSENLWLTKDTLTTFLVCLCTSVCSEVFIVFYLLLYFFFYFLTHLWTGRNRKRWFQEQKVSCMWVQVGVRPYSVREHLAQPSACGFCLQRTRSRAAAAFPLRASSVCMCTG